MSRVEAQADHVRHRPGMNDLLGRCLAALPVQVERGIALGDQFTLVRPRSTGPQGMTLPEEPLALARVVRVSDHGITVMLIDPDPAFAQNFINKLVGKYVEENISAKRDETYGANRFLDEQLVLFPVVPLKPVVHPNERRAGRGVRPGATSAAHVTILADAALPLQPAAVA